MPSWIAPLAIMVMLTIATITDLRRRKVPRWLTVGMILAGIIVAGVSGIEALEQSILGLVVGGALLLPFVLLGGFGAGDALLLAAIGTWQGWTFVLYAAVWMALLGGVLAIVALRSGHRNFAYLPAIALGTLVAQLVSLT